MDIADLTQEQLYSFTVIERVCSVFSLLGCFFIIGTFTISKHFHKPINRLVFYASFGNMMSNVATLMSRSFVGSPNSVGCQLQAFLIQIFMPADAYWTLAMAVNVYLTFYYKFDAQRLRKMEIPYLICCYGIPSIIALTYILVSSPERGRVFGNATLWCWISGPWDILRIATNYGPICVVVLISIFIYLRAGREIYLAHRRLKSFGSRDEADIPPHMYDSSRSNRTVQVSMTSEAAPPQTAIDLAPLGRRDLESHPTEIANAIYSVTISSNKIRSSDDQDPFGLPIQSNTVAPHLQTPPAPKQYQTRHVHRKAAYDASNAAWSYTKCALLFFVVMLVTWIPSSGNRIFSVVRGGKISLPLEIMSAMVLPLQGFWNAIIYIATSRNACRILWDDMFAASAQPTGSRGANALGDRGCRAGPNNFQLMGTSTGNPGRSYETESTTELAASTSRTSKMREM